MAPAHPTRLDLALAEVAGHSAGSARRAMFIVLWCGALYGAVMGSFNVAADPQRWLLVAYVAIKTPLLIIATTLLCAPAFFVVNTVLGLREDFAAAWRSVLSSQASTTVALASLSPLTLFVYACGVDHRLALIWNQFAFLCAAIAAQAVIARKYRPLIASNPNHRYTLLLWICLYAIVGIQMGWMFRPFVGNPGLPVSFFRQEPFTNAYIAVVRVLVGK